MNPAVKRYKKKYGAAADAIARLDIDQITREQIAEVLAEAFRGQDDFNEDIFRLTASDPLCPCAGPEEPFTVPCPQGIEIRIAMHLRDAPDGRSAAWRPVRPVVRCLTCGSQYVLGARS